MKPFVLVGEAFAWVPPIPQYRSYYTLGRGACWLRPAVPKARLEIRFPNVPDVARLWPSDNDDDTDSDDTEKRDVQTGAVPPFSSCQLRLPT